MAAFEAGEPPAFAPWAPIAAGLVAYAMGIIAVTLLAAVVAVSGGDVDTNDLPTGIVLGATIVQDALLVGLAVVFARLGGVTPTPAIFGLRRVAFWRGFGYAVLAFALFYVFFYAWDAAVSINEEDDLARDLGAEDSAVNLVAVAFLVAIAAPLAEELFFRGFLFPALWRWRGWVFGAVVSGVIFGLVHVAGTPLVFLAPLAVLGFLLCALYKWTGSLLPGMGLHAFNNSLALAITLDWEAWQVLCAIVAAPAAVVWIGARLADWRPGMLARA